MDVFDACSHRHPHLFRGSVVRNKVANMKPKHAEPKTEYVKPLPYVNTMKYFMIANENGEPVIEKVARLYINDCSTLFFSRSEAEAYARRYFNSEKGWNVLSIKIEVL